MLAPEGTAFCQRRMLLDRLLRASYRRLEVKDGSGVVPCPRRADVHLEEQDAVLQQLSVTANWLQDARRVFDAVRSAVQAMGELLAEQQHLDVTRVQVEDAPLVGSLAESSEAERRGLRRELDALHRSDYGHIGPALPEEAHRATSSSVPEPGGQASTGADAADAIVRLESELSVLKAKLEDAELRHHEKASVLAARLQDAQSRLAEAGRGATAERAAAVAMSNSFKSELDEAAAQHGKTVIQLSEAEAALRASRDETAAALVQLEGAHEQLAEAVALAADLRQEVAEYADGLQVAENKAAACVEELRHKSAGVRVWIVLFSLQTVGSCTSDAGALFGCVQSSLPCGKRCRRCSARLISRQQCAPSARSIFGRRTNH